MKRKKLLIAVSLIAVILVLALVGMLLFGDDVVTVCRCVVTPQGTIYMVRHEGPVQLHGLDVSDFETGDLLLIHHAAAFAESYPEQTRAYFAVKLAGGTEQDVPERAMEILREMGIIDR